MCHELFDGYVIDVVAEVPGTYQLDPLGQTPPGVAWHADDGYPKTVPYGFRGDRFTGVDVQDGDEVGHGDDIPPVSNSDEMLVLEVYLEFGTGVFVYAFHVCFAPGEATDRAALDIDDLPFEDQEAFCDTPDGFDGVGLFLPCCPNGLADFFGESHGVPNGQLLELFAGGCIQGDQGGTSHIYGDAARQCFGPLVVDGVDKDVVAFFIGHRHGCGVDTEDGVSDHLKFWKRAPHTVAIDQGQTHGGGYRDGHHRIEPASFYGHYSGDRFTDIAGKRFEGGDNFLAVGYLFDHHCGRAHHGSRYNQLVISDFIEVQELDRAVLPNCLLGHQFADIRISSTACSQNGGSEGHVIYV